MDRFNMTDLTSTGPGTTVLDANAPESPPPVGRLPLPEIAPSPAAGKLAGKILDRHAEQIGATLPLCPTIQTSENSTPTAPDR
jgi:hypothetical protein